MPSEIYITSIDKERIKKILDKIPVGSKGSDTPAGNLERELDRAIIVDSPQIPQDVVTMNTKVLLHLYGEDVEISLVYPEVADLASMKLSVFSPIGIAILGYREGNIVEWEVPSGISKIHIKKILYQPEAAGDYHM